MRGLWHAHNLVEGGGTSNRQPLAVGPDSTRDQNGDSSKEEKEQWLREAQRLSDENEQAKRPRAWVDKGEDQM